MYYYLIDIVTIIQCLIERFWGQVYYKMCPSVYTRGMLSKLANIEKNIDKTHELLVTKYSIVSF